LAFDQEPDGPCAENARQKKVGPKSGTDDQRKTLQSMVALGFASDGSWQARADRSEHREIAGAT